MTVRFSEEGQSCLACLLDVARSMGDPVHLHMENGKLENGQDTLCSNAINALRARIIQDKLSRKCSEEDLKRMNDGNWWLSTFVRAHNYDVDITYAVIAECIQWRRNFQVENISILGMKPLLDRRVAYLHGKDLANYSILWINLAQYRPGDTGFENVFVFWLERHTMETKAQPLTILIDMTGASMKNMDFNIFKFMLHALKYYYPSTVRDMLVFESPVMLNASWRVVKSWLDPAHPQIQHVTRHNINQFVDSKYLPSHMGGEDTFVFTMDDLAKCLPAGRQENGNSSDTELIQEKNNLDSVVMKRAVTFDDHDDDIIREVPLTLNSRKMSNGNGNVKRSIPQTLKPVVDARLNSPEVDWIKNAFLYICPRDVLTLHRVENFAEYVEVVAIRNTSTESVMFKIKTTSPEKFRVRPSMGTISPGSTEIIRVYLQSEYKTSCNREKFLLMALETENNNLETFTDLWKKVDREKKVEQKLRCRVNDDGSNDSPDKPERKISSGSHQIDQLRAECNALQRTVYLLVLIVKQPRIESFYRRA
ncbi:unnamed protein product [Cylicocyclus nassatus]|uniref:Major sperm protein n=1 Tax=Cylicocyclus nassatus TaxID=53992 RepID=A0AA36GVE5_CYLNA|nr:unnamed protein product [Cylicocyclus nassatus]